MSDLIQHLLDSGLVIQDDLLTEEQKKQNESNKAIYEKESDNE